MDQAIQSKGRDCQTGLKEKQDSTHAVYKRHTLDPKIQID